MTHDNTLGKYIYICRHMHKCIIVMIVMLFESISYHMVYSWEGQTIFTEWLRIYSVYIYIVSLSQYIIYMHIIHHTCINTKWLSECVIQMQNWQLPPCLEINESSFTLFARLPGEGHNCGDLEQLQLIGCLWFWSPGCLKNHWVCGIRRGYKIQNRKLTAGWALEKGHWFQTWQFWVSIVRCLGCFCLFCCGFLFWQNFNWTAVEHPWTLDPNSAFFHWSIQPGGLDMFDWKKSQTSSNKDM